MIFFLTKLGWTFVAGIKNRRYHRQPDEGETIINWIVSIIGCAFFLIGLVTA